MSLNEIPQTLTDRAAVASLGSWLPSASKPNSRTEEMPTDSEFRRIDYLFVA
jgi:hypothetical protein